MYCKLWSRKTGRSCIHLKLMAPATLPRSAQYADDALILMKGDLPSVRRLKTILNQFAAATGLRINFSQSTLVPIHMQEGDLLPCVDVLGCRLEGFPQTYLGLPLSTSKLRTSAFDPYIANVDRRLAGWQARLLNPMGRAVLVNAVLSSQLVYIMCAALLPPCVVSQVDRRRRGFLWSGEGTASGGQCLVASERVCDDRGCGGLGVKGLGLQNVCLLQPLSSWAVWVRARACLATTEGVVAGSHWEALRALLPLLYQAITTSSVSPGRDKNVYVC